MSTKMIVEDAISNTTNGVKAREIFFVDDDKEELGIFKLALKDIKIPINLTYARSGDDLFKILEQSTPDILFLDLHLPGRSGITCLKMLRFNKKYDSIPIIIYSKLSTHLLVNDCYLAKANLYLVKPVSIGKLRSSISTIIEANWTPQPLVSIDTFVVR